MSKDTCVRLNCSVFCIGYDLGQYYSRVRIYEYEDYTDVKFLKFHISGPTKLANWSFIIRTNNKCNNYQAHIHLY